MAPAVHLEAVRILEHRASGGSRLTAGLKALGAAADSSRDPDACTEVLAHTDQAADGLVGRGQELDNLAPHEDRDAAEGAADSCWVAVDQVVEAVGDSHLPHWARHNGDQMDIRDCQAAAAHRLALEDHALRAKIQM